MKRLLLTALTCCIGYAATCQEIESDKIDQFTKKRTVTTTEVIIHKNRDRKVKANVFRTTIDSKDYYMLSFNLQLFSIASVRKGDLLEVLLDNDEVLNIRAYDHEVANYLSNSKMYSLYTNYLLDTDELKALLNHKVKSIRFRLGDDIATYENLEEKYQGIIQNTLKLVATNESVATTF